MICVEEIGPSGVVIPRDETPSLARSRHSRSLVPFFTVRQEGGGPGSWGKEDRLYRGTAESQFG